MPTHVKTGGNWNIVKSMFYKQNGVWVPVQRGYTKVAGTWVEIFSAAVTAIVSATTTNLNVSTLFSTADWQSTKKKIVQIAAGVTIGSANTAIAALLTGTGRGGELEIIIDGEVQGAGGLPNGGAGGPAINVQQAGAVIINNGAVRGGGGGGGQGGAGTATVLGARDPASGWYLNPEVFDSANPQWNWAESNAFFSSNIVWNGTNITSNFPNGTTQIDVGGFRYYRGPQYTGSFYYVARQSVSTGPTSGGSGGRGQGYDGAAASGQAGGTNAGFGGAGGAYGQAGSTGNAGNAGAGQAGGSAGPAITGQARTFTNNGTVNGAVT